MKGNFLPTRTFRDLTDLNTQARHWVLHEAGVRIHGTTKEKPLDRFAIERPFLKPLPEIAPDLGVWNKVSVHRDCHVSFDKSLYSVPFTLVGKRLWLKATDTTVRIFEDYRLVATHLRARKAGTRRTVRDHLPPEAQAFFAQDRNWCAELIEKLLTDRILERLRAAQGVLRLAKQYGSQRLEAACIRALAHDSAHYRTVKTILAGRFDQRPLQASEAQNTAYVSQARFARAARDLFPLEPAAESAAADVFVPTANG